MLLPRRSPSSSQDEDQSTTLRRATVLYAFLPSVYSAAPLSNGNASPADGRDQGQQGAGQPSLSGARLGRRRSKALLAISSGGQKADVV